MSGGTDLRRKGEAPTGGRIAAFAPVAREDARVLVLGSMPSVESLRQGFYYGHPRNAFWRILADVFGAPLPCGIPEKTALLRENGIALWDVLASCAREGSLDSAIREPEPNDFAALFARCPGIERVLFNGATAKSLFMRCAARYLEGRAWAQMPSTSPAYTLSYERKLALWRRGLKDEHESL